VAEPLIMGVNVTRWRPEFSRREPLLRPVTAMAPTGNVSGSGPWPLGEGSIGRAGRHLVSLTGARSASRTAWVWWVALRPSKVGPSVQLLAVVTFAWRVSE